MPSNKDTVRLSFDVSCELHNFLLDSQNEDGTTPSEVLRRGISVLKAFRSQRAFGRTHLGFTNNPSNLDAEITFNR
jgi:hypothetical protein